MNPYQYSCSCSVCGGPGMAHVRAMGRDWLGDTFVHNDPSICEHYIEEANREKDARIKELEDQLKGSKKS
jgi:hypothetical protein